MYTWLIKKVSWVIRHTLNFMRLSQFSLILFFQVSVSCLAYYHVSNVLISNHCKFYSLLFLFSSFLFFSVIICTKHHSIQFNSIQFHTIPSVFANIIQLTIFYQYHLNSYHYIDLSPSYRAVTASSPQLNLPILISLCSYLTVQSRLLIPIYGRLTDSIRPIWRHVRGRKIGHLLRLTISINRPGH